MQTGKKRFMPVLCRRAKADQMISELNEQSRGDDHARHVRREETRIMHDLQDRCGVILLKPGLIKCFAAITQRMIHIDKNLAIYRSLRIDQRDAAGEVLRESPCRHSVHG